MIRIGAWLRERWQRAERPLADWIFAVLLLATAIGVGWLAARHDRYWDWTADRTNTLAPETQAILKQVQAPLKATVFIDPQDPLGKSIGRLLARYAQALPALEVRFVDPQRFPEQARSAKVSLAGQIALEYRGRRETLGEIGERALSAAIARLSTAQAPWVAVLEGHGERRIEGEGPTDLSRFAQELRGQGYLLRGLDLATVTEVPANTGLILITDPAIPLFPGEADRLGRYLDRGGNLIWLLDPGPLNGLEALASQLGVGRLPGTVVDAKAADVGADTPDVAVISTYPDDALAGGLQAPAVLPGAAAFDTRTAPGWTLAGFLSTGATSWNETGRLQGEISRDEVVGEEAGPLPVVLALTRPVGDSGRVQRVLLVGDADFVSNAHIGAYGNRALGVRLLRWASGEDGLLPLPPPLQAAEALVLTPSRRLLLGIGALAVLPGFFVIAGLAMRWTRSRG